MGWLHWPPGAGVRSTSGGADWTHCVIDGVGWLGLALVAFVGAGLGHSVIGGYEQPVFLGVLVTALAFEGVWRSGRGTNAVTARSQHVSRSRASGETPARSDDGHRLPRE